MSTNPDNLDDIVEELAAWLLEDLAKLEETERIARKAPSHLSSSHAVNISQPQEERRHGPGTKQRQRKR